MPKSLVKNTTVRDKDILTLLSYENYLKIQVFLLLFVSLFAFLKGLFIHPKHFMPHLKERKLLSIVGDAYKTVRYQPLLVSYILLTYGRKVGTMCPGYFIHMLNNL